jgi:hypothetical protein
MRWLAVVVAMSGVPLVLHAQVPRLDPGAGKSDSVQQMSAADSASYRARTTASKSLFHECTGHAFQTCASGETLARLSVDGTGYGVVLSVFDERNGTQRSLFLWRITGRVGIGAAEDEEGPGGGKGKGGRRGGRARRGGG